MKPAEILLIAPDMDLYQRAKKLQGEIDIRFDVKYAFLETAVSLVAIQEKAENVKVVVSRGATMRLLRESHVKAALIDIKMTDMEMLRVLSNAQKISSKIAVVGFLSPFIERAQLLSGMLGFEVGTYTIRHNAETLQKVQEAVTDGYQVIVGVEGPCSYAQELGVAAMLFTTSEHIIVEALTEADKVFTAIKMQLSQSKRQSAILNTIRDGIYSVGADGHIQYRNMAAGDLIPSEAENIAELFGQEILPLIARRQSLFGEVFSVGEEAFVVNISPVSIEQEHIETIISISPLKRLQAIEGKTRLKLAAGSFTAKYHFSDILTQDGGMRQLLEQCRQYARHDATVLISGESGTGKELIAQSIHHASPRSQGPFVGINCAALPESLMESELFGYADGAFTGARKNGKPGFFELAHGGTLFLDEIGEITPSVQARLLRVLEEKTILRIGDDKNIYVDVRVIFASNRDLLQMVKEGTFRKDLYYRINVLRVQVPSLSQRQGDIQLLVKAYVRQYCSKFGKPSASFDEGALALLQQYSWPGNIRELRNIAERITVNLQKNVVTAEDVLLCIDDTAGLTQPVPPHQAAVRTVRDQEYHLIKQALVACGGNKDQVCQQLGISKTTLWRRMKACNLS